MQEIIKISKEISEIKKRKWIKDYNPRKEPILINIPKIERKREMGLRITLPWKSLFYLLQKKWKKK